MKDENGKKIAMEGRLIVDGVDKKDHHYHKVGMDLNPKSENEQLDFIEKSIKSSNKK